MESTTTVDRPQSPSGELGRLLDELLYLEDYYTQHNGAHGWDLWAVRQLRSEAEQLIPMRDGGDHDSQ